MSLHFSLKRIKLRQYIGPIALLLTILLFFLTRSSTTYPNTLTSSSLTNITLHKRHSNQPSKTILTNPQPPPSITRLDCTNTIRLGDAYGGWELCRPIPTNSLSGQLVYTIGIGRNIKWDIEMMATYHTIHHGWDPTPTAADHFSKHPIPDGFSFHRIGLGADDGNLTLKLPVGNGDSFTVMEYGQPAQKGTVTTVPILTVQSMLNLLGHSHLAILKIDIEGAEFDVIKKWGKLGYYPPADQVLIEFHQRYFKHEKHSSKLVAEAVQTMKELGFDMVSRTTLVCILYFIIVVVFCHLLEILSIFVFLLLTFLSSLFSFVYFV